ncbi:molybdenum cofactor guanylyltransferase [Ochrobactrum sp. Marseille-Q0166]|uniref:molybdenum cofactor guanylyltransferase n=1 Tax=Ochrobactrum sp. Marseille-Q0166 TaxID=2761105 RepID=UPI001654EB33|nr:molybdenum cofactor guanylyltransferase [Ochrobactrum sp. Marseille-Q0166]MBC8717510.1 molybdenum cofactor guanylyltransferase [Ochrobactrum sp. Marseille-Q0166]
MPKFNNIAGVIIAGGQSSRMHADGICGDKFLQLLGTKTILEHVAARLKPQVDHLFLNTNSDQTNLPNLNIPIILDKKSRNGGPLVGIKTALEYAHDFAFLLCVPADSPFLPTNLLVQFYNRHKQTNARIVLASSNGRTHPIFGLWKTDLLQPLSDWLERSDKASILAFAHTIGFEEVEFPLKSLPETTGNYDPFFNINRAEDLTNARKLYETLQW